MRDAIDRAAAPDISIVIVSYNTRIMTLECIRSVLAQTTAVLYEVIVIDNASTDGSPEAIRANFPQVELITSQENLGFACANNIAAMRARGRRFLLLNPDTLILNHAIDRLHEFADENPRLGIWGGRTVLSDGRLNPGSCWGDATLWSIFCWATGLIYLKRSSAVFNPEGYGSWKRDSIRAVDIVTGCFLLIDRELWEQLDGFDPEFFMYGEEADLCRRARKLGACPTITPAATIIHYGQSSEPDHAEQRIKVLAGRITLLRHHHSAATIVAGRTLYMMLPLLRLLAYGTAGLVSGRNDFREKAQGWRYVWQHRQRWVNGWSNIGVRSARGNPRNTVSNETGAAKHPPGGALSRSRHQG
ncbi:hypothetical protein BST63_03915 [Bradyrhizobium canariense]|uniref:Glycosyltransferase 2-like domain-containing protein n=1 Tax=Bradyrhizobium canariense TaxID=255045 RepID=A0ABX3XAM6_9BRAD|nr:glycosyltransferase family 2 protein [Bradyrhizobium canariense]OSJ19126.1 hypothetical protein BSR47_04275 [Bradyrhizobium canariense]OSJ34295.1 hypothetical protein BST63_03915 [Bradyrhizobium canariense]